MNIITKEKRRVDYSVEYATVHTDEFIRASILKGIERVQAEEQVLVEKTLTYNKTVLIDNYTSEYNLLDVNAYMKFLESLKAKPDFYALESEIAKFAPPVLEHIAPAMKESYIEYTKTHNRVASSLCRAIFYLLRLGYLVDNSVYDSMPSVSDNLIVILPESMKEIEIKVGQLLKNSDFSAITHRVNYVFFNDKDVLPITREVS